MSNAVAKIEFDNEQMAVIEAQFFPAGATKAEQQYCFAVARELGLNPITREIYFVPRRQKIGDRMVNKTEAMVGRDGFLAIAHKSGQIAGMETSCCIKDVPQLENGKWIVKPELVAECTVWRKDSSKPFTAQVSYNEYCQKTAEGKPTKFWAEKPETMLKKVAESQALRKAFNIHGVYCPEEIGAGFETDSGEIITLSSATNVVRQDASASHLSVVTPQRQMPQNTAVASDQYPPDPDPPATQGVIEAEELPTDDEKEWPVSAPPEPKRASNDLMQEIIGLLENHNIQYEVDTEASEIRAYNCFSQKDLLKASGFRWLSSIKAWTLNFEGAPF